MGPLQEDGKNVNHEDEVRSVLVEILNVPGAFREQFVVVGGWVPDLLYPGKQDVGSIDVDLAVAPDALGDDAYSTIPARMSDAGLSRFGLLKIFVLIF